MFNRFLLMLILSFSNLGAKGLDEIADLPHAQKLITDVLKTRKLDPNDFEFDFKYAEESLTQWLFIPYKPYLFMSCSYNYSCSWSEKEGIIIYYKEVFVGHLLGIRRSDLQQLNDILAHHQDSLDKPVVKGISLTRSEFIDAMKFAIGHELQHYFDQAAVLAAQNNDCEKFNICMRKQSFDCKRQEEIKADKCTSLDPKLLRAGAKYFKANYDMHKTFYDSMWKNPHQQTDEHPHPLERARYLLVAANAQEVINKKFDAALSCLIKKRKEKKHKEAVINRNLADIEKIVG